MQNYIAVQGCPSCQHPDPEHPQFPWQLELNLNPLYHFWLAEYIVGMHEEQKMH